MVLLSGEAGIGKSRLTAALLERLADEPHTRLCYFCSPQHMDSAFYPIIGQTERAAGFAHGDPAQVKFDKLSALPCLWPLRWVVIHNHRCRKVDALACLVAISTMLGKHWLPKAGQGAFYAPEQCT
jgi:hypothetical protein